MTICIQANDGTPLMPSYNIKKVRKQIKNGDAIIVSYHPFTIRYTSSNHKRCIQPIEIGGCRISNDRHFS